MDVDGLAADQVAGDGPHASSMIAIRAAADEADVRSVRAVRGLQRVAANRPLANRALFNVNVDFGGRFGVGSGHADRSIVVVFDVVAGDLQIANLAPLNANSSQPTVTDVAAGNDRLVQVDVIQKHADAGVL